jgi:hypothetical protein
MAFHGNKIGTLRSYSDGSSTIKLNKDDALVQAIFTTLVEEVTSKGFVQDPQIPHMFHYQMDIEEAQAVIQEIEDAQQVLGVGDIDNIRNNEEESANGSD